MESEAQVIEAPPTVTEKKLSVITLKSKRLQSSFLRAYVICACFGLVFLVINLVLVFFFPSSSDIKAKAAAKRASLWSLPAISWLL